MTRNPERQLHTGENCQPLFRAQRLPGLISLDFGRLPNIVEEGEVVMVGNSDRLKSFLSASSHKFNGVLAPLVDCDSTLPLPIEVARCVHLKVTLVEMSASIHTSSNFVAGALRG